MASAQGGRGAELEQAWPSSSGGFRMGSKARSADVAVVLAQSSATLRVVSA